MNLQTPIRILSDLHFGHPACLVRDAEVLAPLFRGAATILFNGDTVELLSVRHRPRGLVLLQRLAEVCLSAGANPVFINGNHDPVISSANHWDLGRGAILVTHGDILFHDIAPWAREAEIVGPAHTLALREMGWETLLSLERSLVAAKRASLALEMHECIFPAGRAARLAMIARETWPPWRAMRILRLWRETPRRAAALARHYRPGARFVLIGHTHRAGLWHVDSHTVINTGSFLPLSGCLAVEIEDHCLTVHRVERRRAACRLGGAQERFSLPAVPEPEAALVAAG